jgi:hypothetical protein
MKTREYLITTLLLIMLLSVEAAAQNSSPTSAVRSFYALDGKSSQIFNRRNLNTRRPYLSQRLYNLFVEELRKQAAHLRSNPDDKPFFGDGFPFRPIDEPCEVNGRSIGRRYSVMREVRYRGSRAVVPVRFSYARPCTIGPLNYKVELTRSGSGWVIDDIIYEDGSKLSDSMKDHRY